MIDPAVYSAGLPVSDPVATMSFTPVVVPVAGRAVPLRLKVTFPATGDALPVVILSHGHGASNFLASQYGYGPIVEFLAAHGFVVIQPTHLSSRMLGITPSAEGPLFWRSRADDIQQVIDNLADIEAGIPALAGRVDGDRIAAVGHSLGGNTVGLLSGMTMTDSDGTRVNLLDERITARVIIAGPGSGDGLAAAARQRMPILATTDFTAMTPQVLVVVGDNDHNAVFSERPDWRADAYNHSPGPKTLLTMPVAEHLFGGISGYDAAETTDENPDRVAVLRTLIWAYLCSALTPGDTTWDTVNAAAQTQAEPLIHLETK